MKVKVEFTILTEDFGKMEFRKEIEALIADIDSKSKLLNFNMYEMTDITDSDWKMLTGNLFKLPKNK